MRFLVFISLIGGATAQTNVEKIETLLQDYASDCYETAGSITSNNLNKGYCENHQQVGTDGYSAAGLSDGDDNYDANPILECAKRCNALNYGSGFYLEVTSSTSFGGTVYDGQNGASEFLCNCATDDCTTSKDSALKTYMPFKRVADFDTCIAPVPVTCSSMTTAVECCRYAECGYDTSCKDVASVSSDKCPAHVPQGVTDGVTVGLYYLRVGYPYNWNNNGHATPSSTGIQSSDTYQVKVDKCYNACAAETTDYPGFMVQVTSTTCYCMTTDYDETDPALGAASGGWNYNSAYYSASFDGVDTTQEANCQVGEFVQAGECVACELGKTSIGGDATTCAAEVTLAEYQHGDFDWAEPRISSASYYKAPDITDSLYDDTSGVSCDANKCDYPKSLVDPDGGSSTASISNVDSENPYRKKFMDECARGCKAANTGSPYMYIGFHRSYDDYKCFCWNNAATFDVKERTSNVGWTAARYVTLAAPVHCPNHNGDEAACCAADGCAYAAGNDCIAEADLAGNPNLCPVLNEVCTGVYERGDFDFAEPKIFTASYYKAPDITDSLYDDTSGVSCHADRCEYPKSLVDPDGGSSTASIPNIDSENPERQKFIDECARGCKAADTGYPYMKIAFHRSYSEYSCACWNNAATFEVEERDGNAGWAAAKYECTTPYTATALCWEGSGTSTTLVDCDQATDSSNVNQCQPFGGGQHTSDNKYCVVVRCH